MESGKIPDSNIVATTRSFGNNRKRFGPPQARLKSPSGYRADPSAVKKTSLHFIEVKLPKEMMVTGIATQGLGGEWVTKYKLMAGQTEKDYVRFRDVNDAIKVRMLTNSAFSSMGQKRKKYRVPEGKEPITFHTRLDALTNGQQGISRG